MKKKPQAEAAQEGLCETMGEIYKDQRPRNWAQMVGQDAVVSLLKSQLAEDKVPHTLLFHGPTGTGKTTAARILAAKLNGGIASKEDVVELNCAGEARGIDSIRALRESFRKRSFKAGGKRVYILDECHRLTADSVEALLKMTEDTPKYVYVVLCSSLPEKLPASLRGRASKYKFERGSLEDIRSLVKKEAKRYAIPLSDTESAVVAEAADGSYREALVTLNSLRFATDANHRKSLLRKIEEGVDTSALCRALLKGGGVKEWPKVKDCLVALRSTHDAESVRWRILEYMVAVALKQSSMSSILARAVWVSSCFSDSCRDSGYSGLVTASFAAMGGK